MNKKWMPHIIAVMTLVAFIVLGLASSTTPSEVYDMAYNRGDILTLASYGQWERVLNLLKSEKNLDIDAINTQTNYGDGFVNYHTRTILMYAAKAGKFDVVQALVNKGANVNLRVTSANSTDRGKTASVFAYEAGYIEIVEYLKQHGTVEFDQVQQFQAPQQGGSSSGAAASPSQRVYSVTVWYTSSGTRLASFYPVTASSKDEAEREAQRMWKNQFGWNTSLKFEEAVAQ